MRGGKRSFRLKASVLRETGSVSNYNLEFVLQLGRVTKIVRVLLVRLPFTSESQASGAGECNPRPKNKNVALSNKYLFIFTFDIHL